MANPELVYVTYIRTTAETLWAALTDGAFTQRYWYGRRVASAWTVGSPVQFFDGDSGVLTDSGVVEAYEPPRGLAYTFRPEFSPEARAQGYSRVTFTLEPQPEGLVKLTLVHDRLPDEASAAGFREGWAPILSSLKTLLETGTPLPELRALVERGRPR